MYYRTFYNLLSTTLFLVFFYATGMSQAPANDSLCNATPLTVGAACSASTNGTLTNASLEMNEPLGSCFSSFPATMSSVWFSFTAPPSGLVMVSANFPGVNALESASTALYSMRGSACSLDSLNEVACNQGESIGPPVEYLPSIAASLTPGETYYVQVVERVIFGTSIQASGSFCIQVEEMQAPANDDVCNAIEITVNDPALTYSNVGATSSFTEFSLAPALDPTDFIGQRSWGFDIVPRHTIWFYFVVPPSGMISIDMTDSVPLGNFNTRLGIERGASGGFVSARNYYDQLPCLTPGDTIYMLLDGGASMLGTQTNMMGRVAIEIKELQREPLSLNSRIYHTGCDSMFSIFDTTIGGIVALPSGGAYRNGLNESTYNVSFG